MILTSSPQCVADSRQFSPGEHIPRLAECERVCTYSECGYFSVAGYRGGTRTVHVHMDARRSDEFWWALAGRGYKLVGEKLVRMSDEESREARTLARAEHGYGYKHW